MVTNIIEIRYTKIPALRRKTPTLNNPLIRSSSHKKSDTSTQDTQRPYTRTVKVIHYKNS